MHNSSATQVSESLVNGTTNGPSARVEGVASDDDVSGVYVHRYIIYGSLGALLGAILVGLTMGAVARAIKKKREESRKRSETSDTARAKSWVLMCHKDAPQRCTSWGYTDNSQPAAEAQPCSEEVPVPNPPSRRLGHTRPSLSTFLATATMTAQRIAGKSAAKGEVGPPAGTTVDLPESLEHFEEYLPPPPVFSDTTVEHTTSSNVRLASTAAQHLEVDLPLPPPPQELHDYETVPYGEEDPLPPPSSGVAEPQHVQTHSLPWTPTGNAATYACLQRETLPHPPMAEKCFQDDHLPPPPPFVEDTPF
ncbi:uncharacterized protein LOC144162760 [Haemaphysalis longicornis]